MHLSENDAVLISDCEPLNHIHQDTKLGRLIAVCRCSITLNKFGKRARGCCVHIFLVYLYTAKQPIYDEMKIIEAQKINIKFIDCNKGIPLASDLQTNLSHNRLVVLDDLMTVATSSKGNTDNLDNFASRDSHHSNISVIFTCQNLTYGGEITKFAC